MVEENEVRAGLSYYERTRVTTKAVKAGLFLRADERRGRLTLELSGPALDPCFRADLEAWLATSG